MNNMPTGVARNTGFSTFTCPPPGALWNQTSFLRQMPWPRPKRASPNPHRNPSGLSAGSADTQIALPEATETNHHSFTCSKTLPKAMRASLPHAGSITRGLPAVNELEAA